MSEIVASRVLSRDLARPAKGSWWAKGSSHGLQDKSADLGPAYVVGRVDVFGARVFLTAVARRQFASKFNQRSARAAEM